MKARFTQSFKIQAVEKALERANDISLKDIADFRGGLQINARKVDWACPKTET